MGGSRWRQAHCIVFPISAKCAPCIGRRPSNGDASMEESYRVYLIGPDGHIMNRVEMICEDDDSAKQRAKQLALDCRVELWKGARMIAGYEPKQ